MSRVNFVCVRVGDRYGPEYVEILFDMVARNASKLEQMTFWCVTDKPDELPDYVNAIPAVEALPGWWAKVALFSPDMPWAKGERVVYFDLDVAITGRLEDLVERKGIIKDWNWPCYNSSVMVWDHGEHDQVWLRFHPGIMSRQPHWALKDLLPAGQVNGGDQEWITDVSRWEVFPAEWFVSYRTCKAWPPHGAKAVIFHGDPKPADIAGGWVEQVWKVGGYTSLPEMNGVNATHDLIRANIQAACERDLPWFTGFGGHKRRAILVCGAPSMRDHIQEIRWHARQGAQIISVNNAWRFLVENGITPGVHVMLDARPENASFVEGAPETTRYLVASQCHPAVFDTLKDREVVLWHNGFGDNSMHREILAPWWDEGPNQRPCILVPGGGTVGLRSLWLCALSGFKVVHVYGMDSSYADTGEHHAYPQAINDADRAIDVRMVDPATGLEKNYRAALWMVRQAEEFRETWADLQREGVTLHLHGKGLIPDIAAQLKRGERA